MCDSQLRVGFGGAYALDWGVIVKAAEAMGIEQDEAFFLKLRSFERVIIEEMNKKNGE